METTGGEHAAWHEQVPAYVAGRLEPEERGRFETHLSACPECAETVAAWRGIASAIREEGETLWEPHPETEVIRAAALGRAGDEPRLARHLAICPSCALEVQAWRDRARGRHEESRGAGQVAPARLGRAGMTLLAAAAGLVVGVGLSLLLTTAPAPIEPGPGSGSPASIEAAPVPLLVLAPARRGAGDEASSVRLIAAHPGLVIAVTPTIPESGADADLVPFELIGPDGGAVFTTSMTVAAIREELRRNEMVTLFVPASTLPPGGYELRFPGQRLAFRVLPAD